MSSNHLLTSRVQMLNPMNSLIRLDSMQERVVRQEDTKGYKA